MPGVDWNSGLMVLAAGLVAGAILVALLGKRPSSRAARAVVSLERRDLEGKRDALLRQLRELEDTAVKRTPAQLARERYALELEAAHAWQELDGLEAASSPPAAVAGAKGRHAEVPPTAPASPDRAGLRGFLWGLGSAVAIGALVFFVSRVVQPREAGGTVTGNLPPVGQGTAGQDDPEEQHLRQVVAANPDDHDARVELAQLYLGRQDLMAVWKETQYVLERVPGHPRALSYGALVRMAMGQGDEAVKMLKQAQAAGPTLLEPHLHLALVYARLGRLKEAEATMAEAQRRFPEQAERLGQLLAQMKQVDPVPAGEGPEPSVPPPAAAGGQSVAGVIELGPRVAASFSPGALVFLIARPVGVSEGPPVAVKRLPAAFPLRFELSSADSMMGQPLPDRVRLEARVDTDGNPLTRNPGDPAARLDSVALGTTDLKLVLKN